MTILKAYKTKTIYVKPFDYDKAYSRLKKACEPYMDLIRTFWVEEESYWVDLKDGIEYSGMVCLHEETITTIKSILKYLAKNYR